MGVIEFFVLIIVTCAIAAFAAWLVKKLEAPAFFVTVIWVVAAIIIVFALATALGLTGYDPKIPRLRG
jgi:NhaP-type Na+/H+ and K+/H+ antiporter